MGTDGSPAGMVRHWARTRPDAPAVSTGGGRSLTFAELDAVSSRLARALLAAGAAPGDRVAFLGRDATTWAVTLVGASKVRAMGVPLNWRLSRPETAEVIADAEPVAVVCEPEFLPLLGLPAVEGAEPQVVVDGAAVPLDAWLAGHDAADPGLPAEPGDVAFLFYTSGTTGRPKGVQLANRNIAANLAKPAPWTIGPGDTVFVPAPTFHVSGSGWLFLCLGVGAHALYVRDIVPADVLRLLESERVTHALVVPALLQMLVRHPVAQEIDFSRLRTLIYGGSPIAPAVLVEARELLGCDLVQGYGLTETCGPITFLGPADHAPGAPEHRLASAGRAVEGVELSVRDPATGEPLPAGDVGEIWTRSDMVMAGYRNRPAEQDAAMTPDGWFRTGDAGYLDADGYLFVTDRVKDMIVSGGENVYPVEVENVLMNHPAIADAAVIGVPHERWGETVKALVVARGGPPAPDEVIAYCRERLAHYKCPTSVDVVDDLPRNPSGKILKRDLRAAYWPAHGRSVG
ncbi:long-chain-fatty-acid--CoA ligase [Actinomadura violacea]|uniref:Long-chain-fatty-acid--CoA ligase n=1 Tax=Actinomadura violacea TaxID=2819934 RepID=A0ABS3RPF9_9ACTN|nr:long-chain-fatty-acid--CoA ligase [Actinomadura violacea]MBO2457944.1 long-chain-fatty-acid--CoA ligase [Actinomadura violacea]